MKPGFMSLNSMESHYAGRIRISQSLHSHYKEPSFKGIRLLTKPVQKVISKSMLNAGDGILAHTLQDFTQGAQNTKFSRMIKLAPQALNDAACGRAGDVTIEVCEPNILSKALENITYPFKDMWLDIGNGLCKGFGKIPALKNSDFVARMQNSKPLQNRRLKNELTDLFYQAAGMTDTLSRDMSNEKFLGAIHKGLEKPQGRYNTKFERPLTRMSTGLVSAAFVGKDFYNVSMYQKNDKKEALKSEKKRFAQEVSRFSLNAFISFVALGTLSKHTNKSQTAATAVLALATFASEIISRVANRVPLLPLTPKQAKEINQKRLQKENISQDSAQKKAQATDIKPKTKENKVKKPMNKQLKTLLNLAASAVALGFALALGRKYSKGFNKCCTAISNGVSGFYNKITKKTVWAPQGDINEFVDKLEDSGYKELASQYKKALADKNLKTVHKGSPVYNLGKKDAWWGCFPGVVKKLWGAFKAPYNLFAGIMKVKPYKVADNAAKDAASNPVLKSLNELYTLGSKKMKSEGAQFNEVMKNTIRNVYNSDTKSQYSNTSLAMVSRTLITLIASYFFVNDFRNKVLIDSNGEDVEHAKEVTNTRIGHKVMNFFTNAFWMSLFNNAFEKTYLGSLAGAAVVTSVTEFCNETTIRKSIGVPTKRMESREELEKFENKNYNNKGLYGEWIKFVSNATGKKRLSEKAKEEQKASGKKPEAKA